MKLEIPQYVALITSVFFLVMPFDRSRSRAGWAKALFIMVGVTGVLVSGTKLLLSLHWITPSIDTATTIHQARVLLCGFALGLILALIVSRQLIGSKHSSSATRGGTF